MRRADRIRAFVRQIWFWFSYHKRELPWRDLTIPDDTRRAYMILVSEVMLQQTQVRRVEVIFKRFLEQFPTIHDLAKASNKEVILVWRGMGYNGRALRLRDAAREIVEDYRPAPAKGCGWAKKTHIAAPVPGCGIVRDGKVSKSRKGKKGNNVVKFPREMDELMAIPGIGPYTAAAIRNFAFGIPTPCVDTNIRRILERVCGGRRDGARAGEERKVLKMSEDVLRVALDGGRRGFEAPPCHSEGFRAKRGIVSNHHGGPPRHDTKNWHAALMDFGSLVCKKNGPRCEICPLAANGLCKSAFRVETRGARVSRQTSRRDVSTGKRMEPGRMVGGRFTPNRIFRGKIVEELRDASGGLPLDEIGKRICLDWSPKAHRRWLRGVIDGLKHDRLVMGCEKKYLLAT